MITATFKRKNNSIVEYEIRGHANYAEKGKDIVCAAVSSLFNTVTNEIIKLDICSGEVVGADNSNKVILDSTTDETDILTGLLLNGMKAIAEEYPEYVVVEVDNRDSRFF